MSRITGIARSTIGRGLVCSAPGFYEDAGAFHPVEGSFTKAFYDRKWSGINVEPGSVFEELAAARRRD